jgi:hypothetical protein
LSGSPTHYAAECIPLGGDPVPIEMFPVALQEEDQVSDRIFLSYHFSQTVHHKHSNNKTYNSWRDNPKKIVTFASVVKHDQYSVNTERVKVMRGEPKLSSVITRVEGKTKTISCHCYMKRRGNNSVNILLGFGLVIEFTDHYH